MTLKNLITNSLQARVDLFDNEHLTAIRLFNGFLEGYPDLVIELYARTLVIFNFASPPEKAQNDVKTIIDYYVNQFPWIQAVILKERNSPKVPDRHGKLIYGKDPDQWIIEQNIYYAIDLSLTLDSTLFLDTRLLRAWIYQHAHNKRVLNTFAYTGSLGVAAKVGKASQVVHLDQSRKFISIAKESYRLNKFKINNADFQVGDFFILTSRLRRSQEKFDIVILDPPFFSVSKGGRVDLNSQYYRLINKVRPLLNEGGCLIAVNNALFVSGQDYMVQLDKICQGGYLVFESIIPVPPDFIGYPNTQCRSLPVDPTPFNHSTKIAVLKSR